MPDYQCFRIEAVQGATLLHLANPDELGRIVITELRDDLSRLIGDGSPERLLVSFADVRHCSSEVIAGLVFARNKLKQRDGEIRLCAMNPDVREVFQMTNLEGKIFDIYDTVDDALADD